MPHCVFMHKADSIYDAIPAEVYIFSSARVAVSKRHVSRNAATALRMKRDMDLVRNLLLHFEAKSEAPGVHAAEVRVDGYTEDQIVLHLNIMAEAGLLVCEPFRSSTNPDRIIRTFVFDLSWKGHEYLDTVRDPAIWKGTKSVLGRVGNWSFGLAVDVARSLALSEARKLGLPL